MTDPRVALDSLPLGAEFTVSGTLIRRQPGKRYEVILDGTKIGVSVRLPMTTAVVSEGTVSPVFRKW